MKTNVILLCDFFRKHFEAQRRRRATTLDAVRGQQRLQTEESTESAAGAGPAAASHAQCWGRALRAGLRSRCKEWHTAGSRAGGRSRLPETVHAHPLKVNLWLADPGVGKEAAHCLGQEELGRHVRLHTRKKVIRVNFELMSCLALKIFISIY